MYTYVSVSQLGVDRYLYIAQHETDIGTPAADGNVHALRMAERRN